MKENIKHDKPAVYTLYQLMKILFLQLFQNEILMHNQKLSPIDIVRSSSRDAYS